MSTDGETPHKRQWIPELTEPPVESGKQHDVEIEDIGDRGGGIAHVDGRYIVFVSNTMVGERATVEIPLAKMNFASAEVIEDETIAS